MGRFKCQICGKCCKEIVINIAYSDITRWLAQKRYDILYQISWIDNYPKEGTGGFYIRETALAPKRSCPFLVDNKCNIYDTRPRACADFPHGHDIWKPCPAWEEIDYHIENKKHLRTKVEQYQDFKKAHESRHHLIKRLFEMRREV